MEQIKFNFYSPAVTLHTHECSKCETIEVCAQDCQERNNVIKCSECITQGIIQEKELRAFLATRVYNPFLKK